jgi:hypothetical protein
MWPDGWLSFYRPADAFLPDGPTLVGACVRLGRSPKSHALTHVICSGRLVADSWAASTGARNHDGFTVRRLPDGEDLPHCQAATQSLCQPSCASAQCCPSNGLGSVWHAALFVRICLHAVKLWPAGQRGNGPGGKGLHGRAESGQSRAAVLAGVVGPACAWLLGVSRPAAADCPGPAWASSCR